MTSWLTHAHNILPEWQAVKVTFFAPWSLSFETKSHVGSFWRRQLTEEEERTVAQLTQQSCTYGVYTVVIIPKTHYSPPLRCLPQLSTQFTNVTNINKAKHYTKNVRMLSDEA